MPAHTRSGEYFNIFTKGAILRTLPWHLKGLVSFRISSNLHVTDLIETDDEPGLLKHPRIFMLAGQLEKNELKALALTRFQSRLKED